MLNERRKQGGIELRGMMEYVGWWLECCGNACTRLIQNEKLISDVSESFLGIYVNFSVKINCWDFSEVSEISFQLSSSTLKRYSIRQLITWLLSIRIREITKQKFYFCRIVFPVHYHNFPKIEKHTHNAIENEG